MGGVIHVSAALSVEVEQRIRLVMRAGLERLGPEFP